MIHLLTLLIQLPKLDEVSFYKVHCCLTSLFRKYPTLAALPGLVREPGTLERLVRFEYRAQVSIPSHQPDQCLTQLFFLKSTLTKHCLHLSMISLQLCIWFLYGTSRCTAVYPSCTMNTNSLYLNLM